MYPPGSPFPVYDRNYWFSNNWKAGQFARDYDFSMPFFSQLQALRTVVPRFSTWNINSENCEYCVVISNSKNCYMSAGIESVNTYYSAAVRNRDCFDCWFNAETELCYEGFFSGNCYQSHYTYYSKNCRDSWFLYDCLNCDNCLGCFALSNKQYYIFNQPHTKEEYEKKLNEIRGSYSKLEAFKQEWEAFKLTQPHRFGNIYNSEQTTGNDNNHAKNCTACFEVIEGENCKHVVVGAFGVTDCMDCFDVSSQSSLVYESIACTSSYNIRFSIWLTNTHDIWYSDLCENSSNLFGCVGLRNKQYCILNKQYTKEEYEALLPKIIQHMNNQPYVDQRGLAYRFGEAIPTELSLFAYNDSVAQEYFPLHQTEAEAQGAKWRVEESKLALITLPADELPDLIADAPANLKSAVIGCLHAGTCIDGCLEVFRILPQELTFYQQQQIPLPRLCPQCRHFKRARQKNPLTLWTRQCLCDGQRWAGHWHAGKTCENRFETTYSPERQEIIFCSECYQQTDFTT